MLRKTFAFEHCQKVDAMNLSAAIVAYDWYTNSGYTISLPSPYNVPPNMNSIITLDGWLGFQPALYGGASPYALLSIQAPPSAAKKLVFGTRIRSWSTWTSAAYDVMAIASAGTNLQIIFDYNELSLIRGVGAVSELYVEIVIDITLNTREVWVNGTLFKSVAFTLTAPNLAAVAAGTYQLSLRQGLWTGTMTYNWFRDIYVVDDVPGDGMVGRLGPQKLIPVYVDQASGPWVSDDGLLDLKTTLNAPYPANAQVVSPVDKTPLTLSLNAAIPDGHKVNALQLWMGGKSLGDTPSNTKIEIKQGGQSLPGVNVTVPRVQGYGLPIGIYPLAPDGAVWTASKIDQTSVVLTPDQ